MWYACIVYHPVCSEYDDEDDHDPVFFETKKEAKKYIRKILLRHVAFKAGGLLNIIDERPMWYKKFYKVFKLKNVCASIHDKDILTFKSRKKSNKELVEILRDVDNYTVNYILSEVICAKWDIHEPTWKKLELKNLDTLDSDSD